MSNCKSCDAEIIWITMVSGKRMPVDGRVEKRIVAKREAGELIYGEVVDTYVSHFATCPNAAQHRRTDND